MLRPPLSVQPRLQKIHHQLLVLPIRSRSCVGAQEAFGLVEGKVVLLGGVWQGPALHYDLQ